jgi:hypothetical protein
VGAAAAAAAAVVAVSEVLAGSRLTCTASVGEGTLNFSLVFHAVIANEVPPLHTVMSTFHGMYTPTVRFLSVCRPWCFPVWLELVRHIPWHLLFLLFNGIYLLGLPAKNGCHPTVGLQCFTTKKAFCAFHSHAAAVSCTARHDGIMHACMFMMNTPAILSSSGCQPCCWAERLGFTCRFLLGY